MGDLPAYETNRTFRLPLIVFTRNIKNVGSKPHPLMNIDDILLKYNRDHLLTMCDLPPKFETNRTFRLPLIVFTGNVTHTHA